MEQQRNSKKKARKYGNVKWTYFAVIMGGILLMVLLGDYLIQNHEAIGQCFKEATVALAPLFSFSIWKHSFQAVGIVVLLFLLIPVILLMAYKASARWTRKKEEKKAEQQQKEEEKKKRDFANMAHEIEIKRDV